MAGLDLSIEGFDRPKSGVGYRFEPLKGAAGPEVELGIASDR